MQHLNINLVYFIFVWNTVDVSWVTSWKHFASHAGFHNTSEDEPWLSKESDDLRGVEGLLFVSQGLS